MLISNFHFYQNVNLYKVLCKADSNVPTCCYSHANNRQFRSTVGGLKIATSTSSVPVFENIRKFDIELKFF